VDYLASEQAYELSEADLDSVSGGIGSAGLVNLDVVAQNLLNHNSVLNNNHVNVAVAALSAVIQRA